MQTSLTVTACSSFTFLRKYHNGRCLRPITLFHLWWNLQKREAITPMDSWMAHHIIQAGTSESTMRTPWSYTKILSRNIANRPRRSECIVKATVETERLSVWTSRLSSLISKFNCPPLAWNHIMSSQPQSGLILTTCRL